MLMIILVFLHLLNCLIAWEVVNFLRGEALSLFVVLLCDLLDVAVFTLIDDAGELVEHQDVVG